MAYDLSKKTRAGNKTDRLQGRAAAGYRERGEPGAKIKAKRSVDSVSANYFCKQAKGKGKRVECGVATWAGGSDLLITFRSNLWDQRYHLKTYFGH
jgi:hypothetical protein